MTIKVKGYYVSFLPEEGIINHAFVCRHEAMSLAHSEAGADQWVPLGQTDKPEKICYHLLFHALFLILPPFCEGVGKGLSKEQRKRKSVIGGDERKRRGEFGLGKSHGGA